MYLFVSHWLLPKTVRMELGTVTMPHRVLINFILQKKVTLYGNEVHTEFHLQLLCLLDPKLCYINNLVEHTWIRQKENFL